nr:hypothetical protein [Photorhabdus aegyptia]
MSVTFSSNPVSVCPSMPAAPRLAFTRLYASHTCLLLTGNGFADFAAVLPPASSPVVAAPLSAQWGRPFALDLLRSFIATTACSAPVLRIGTLTLMGPPLALLPLHRSDRFPRSPQEPG